MILCSGCFDGLHAGHMAYLEKAATYKRPFEYVAVAVAPDSYIRSEKNREPYWHQSERREALSHVRHVSFTIAQMEPSAAETIEKWRPRLFIKGIDWLRTLPDDVIEACARVNARVVFVRTERTHTSEARA